MSTTKQGGSDKKLAWIGFILVFPALFFVLANVLKYGLGIGFLAETLDVFYAKADRLRVFNTVSPIVFLGGLGLAVFLNLYPILRLSLQRANDTVTCTATLKIRGWNLVIVGVSFLLLAILVGYAVLENLAKH